MTDTPNEAVAISHPSEPHPKRKSHRTLRLALTWGAVTLVVAGGGFATWRYTSTHRATPVNYTTAAATRGPISAKVTASGTVSALVTVSVGCQVSGRILSLSADFESVVKKGQVVANIDPEYFRAAASQAAANNLAAKAGLTKAEANLVQTERQFARSKALYDEGIVAKTDLELAEANRDSAAADVGAAKAQIAQTAAAAEQAQLNLKYTTIISPIDGVVISRNVDVGQTVAATLQAPTLFTIAQDLTKMQVDTSVAEADVGKLRAGMPVTFTVDAYPDVAFNGSVRQVRDAAVTIQNVVTYDAVIDVDNDKHLLKPGMTATATFVYATRDDVISIPNSALRFKPDDATLAAMTNGSPKAAVPSATTERSIWIKSGQTVKPLVVRVGLTDGSRTEIVNGDVQPDQDVVVEATLDKGSGS